MRGRVGAAVLALLVAAGLLWASSRVTWVSVTASDDLRGTREVSLAGSSWAAGTVPLALALLASVAAVLAVRGWARRVVAVLVVLVAVGAVVPAGSLLVSGSDPDPATAAGLLDPPARPGTVATTAGAVGPVLALLAALVAAAAAAVLLRAPKTGGGLSSKYQTPAARRRAATAEVGTGPVEPDADADALSERVLWDALDAGTDPTLDPDPAGGGPSRDAGHPAATLGGQAENHTDGDVDAAAGSASEHTQQGGPGAS